MFKNLELSLWELFVYFTTGILIVALVLIQLAVAHSRIELFKSFIELPAPIVLTILPFLLLLLGLLLEPIANWSGKNITERIRSRLKFRTTNSASAEHDALKRLVETEFISKEVMKSDAGTFQLCKDFVIQNNLPTPFMAFLSKFGFYRNAAFLFYANALISIVHARSSTYLILAISSLLLGVLFENRSIDFFGHMTGLVYRNLIIKKKLSA